MKIDRLNLKDPLLLLLLVLLLFSSCEKDPDRIGMEVTPTQDLLFANESDTFTTDAYSVAEDSLVTAFTTLNLAGSLLDPVFGRTTAGFVSQIGLSSVNPDFGTNPVQDSLVLVLGYNSYYGDTSHLMTLKVFELTGGLSDEKTYYSHSAISYESSEYARLTFYPHPKDSVWVDTVMKAPQLRINLSRIRPDLGNKILYAPAQALSDNSSFQEYFKGLYVAATPVTYGGAILYFNLLSQNTRLKLYYHNDASDSLVYQMVVNENCIRFNRFDHDGYDLASQDFRKQVIFGDTALGKDILYIQSMAGVKVKLRFPYLKNWAKDRKIAINDAQLIVPVYETSPGETPVTKLTLTILNDDGTQSILPDQSIGDTYFGGSFDKTSGTYRFHVTQYVQDVLKEGYSDKGLYLKATSASVRANRSILSGPEHLTRPLRLRIVCSFVN